MKRSTTWGEWSRQLAVVFFCWALGSTVSGLIVASALGAGETSLLVVLCAWVLAIPGFLIHSVFRWRMRPIND